MASKSEDFHKVLGSSSSSIDDVEPEKTTIVHIDVLPDGDVKSASASDDELTTLPPADRGKGAWMFLAGCFVFEALVWGT